MEWWKWLIAMGAVTLMAVRLGDVWTRGRRARRWWERAIDAYNRGDLAEAETAFRKVVRLAPIWAPARYNLAGVLLQRGDLDEAEEQLRMATKLEPRNGEMHRDLGIFLAHYRQDRADDAIESLEKALKYAPKLREELAQAQSLDHLREHERFRKLFG
jgi:tetratricopeptide (TPR) repeat protein